MPTTTITGKKLKEYYGTPVSLWTMKAALQGTYQFFFKDPNQTPRTGSVTLDACGTVTNTSFGAQYHEVGLMLGLKKPVTHLLTSFSGAIGVKAGGPTAGLAA